MSDLAPREYTLHSLHRLRPKVHPPRKKKGQAVIFLANFFGAVSSTKSNRATRLEVHHSVAGAVRSGVASVSEVQAEPQGGGGPNEQGDRTKIGATIRRHRN